MNTPLVLMETTLEIHHPVVTCITLQPSVFLFFSPRIEEEGWDKYIIPSKTEPEKYKVSRTFSFIKSRMYSTRSKKVHTLNGVLKPNERFSASSRSRADVPEKQTRSLKSQHFILIINPS